MKEWYWLFFKVIFTWKYIKIIFCSSFKNYFRYQYIKTIKKHKKIILNKKYFQVFWKHFLKHNHKQHLTLELIILIIPHEYHFTGYLQNLWYKNSLIRTLSRFKKSYIFKRTWFQRFYFKKQKLKLTPVKSSNKQTIIRCYSYANNKGTKFI